MCVSGGGGGGISCPADGKGHPCRTVTSPWPARPPDPFPTVAGARPRRSCPLHRRPSGSLASSLAAFVPPQSPRLVSCVYSMSTFRYAYIYVHIEICTEFTKNMWRRRWWGRHWQVNGLGRSCEGWEVPGGDGPDTQAMFRPWDGLPSVPRPECRQMNRTWILSTLVSSGGLSHSSDVGESSWRQLTLACKGMTVRDSLHCMLQQYYFNISAQCVRSDIQLNQNLWIFKYYPLIKIFSSQ